MSLYGAERIVCGTDGTEFGCDWTRKALAEAQIGEEAREHILHRNAAAMLARVASTARRTNLSADGETPSHSRGAMNARSREKRTFPVLVGKGRF